MNFKFAAPLVAAMMSIFPYSHATASSSLRLYYQLNAGMQSDTNTPVPSNWFAINPAYSDWTFLGSPYDCSNWTPDPQAMPKGKEFEQLRQCFIEQQRLSQSREQHNKTNEIRNVGKPVIEKGTGQISENQVAIGALEQWIAISALYTEWVTRSDFHSCGTWSPDAASKTVTTSFTQTTECKADQTRERQDRKKEINTGEIANDGDVVIEAQLLNKPMSRQYNVNITDWAVSKTAYNCTNWSPDEKTIGKGITFEQNASNCKVDQARVRSESYTDHNTGTVVSIPDKNESRTLSNQPDVRNAVGTLEQWMDTTPEYSTWTTTNALYGCSNWSPAPSTITDTKTVTQISGNCSNDQTRTRQDREKEQFTGEIREKGVPVEESRTTILQTATRQYSVVVGAWVNSGAYTCSNWSPSVETVKIGQSFTQTATDCSVPQSRTRAESYVDHNSGKTVSVTVSPNTQLLQNQTQTRTSIGTLENWAATTPAYTAWTNTSALDNCSNWAPLPSTKTSSSIFTQTASNCTTDQTRNRQDREQESTTGEIRNKGVPVAETQRLTAQTATRSYTVSVSSWANKGAIFACSNWSPDPATQPTGLTFEQTATNCKQDQDRTRIESYVDHKSASTVVVGSTTETQTLTGQTSKQNAIGTKETWVATSPTYTAWVNTSGVYNCQTWAPLPTAMLATGTYTQNSSNCSLNQSRNKQNREQETTTLAVRNAGAPIAETQTLTNQSASRSYTVTLGAWYNVNGNIYGCSNWSPATNTQPKAVGFYQTATDCKVDQQRTRAESYVDNVSGATVQVPKPNESKAATTSTTRYAVGNGDIASCGYYYDPAGNTPAWRWWGDGNSAWTGNAIPGVASMWASVATLQIPFSNPAAYNAGLSKVSDYEMRYTNGTYTWRIYRGAYRGPVNGFQMYDLCIQ